MGRFTIPDAPRAYQRTSWDDSEFKWVCDCPDYGLTPAPNHIGECQVCYRPVYDDAGVRVCRSS